MELHQTKNVCTVKEQQNRKATYRMGTDICK